MTTVHREGDRRIAYTKGSADVLLKHCTRIWKNGKITDISGEDRRKICLLYTSPHQLSYVTHSGEGEGLLFYGNTILPFIDHFPNCLLYTSRCV